MAREWDEVMLWALAEKISERIDMIHQEGLINAQRKQRELELGPGGNVVDFASHRRQRDRTDRLPSVQLQSKRNTP